MLVFSNDNTFKTNMPTIDKLSFNRVIKAYIYSYHLSNTTHCRRYIHETMISATRKLILKYVLK